MSEQKQRPIIDVPAEQASSNFFVLIGHEKKVNVQVTLRGCLTDEQIEAHVQTVVAGIKRYLDLGAAPSVKYPDLVDCVPPAPVDVAPQAQQAVEPPKPVAQPTQPQAKQSQVLTIHAQKMEVTPRADGKVDLKFYADGHQYPDLYTAKTPADAVTLLSNAGEWTPAHFGAAQSYTVNLVVSYVLSDKLNSKGKPYKNIQSIVMGS